MTIRKATASDLPRIIEIKKINFELAMPEHSRTVLDRFSAQCTLEHELAGLDRKEVFVLIDPMGSLVGTVSLANFAKNGVDRWSVSNMFVAPEAQKSGYGRQLMEYLLHLARSKKITVLHSPSSLTARKFYAKFGFTVDADQPDFREEEITWMTLRLK